MKKYLITSALPYINGIKHLGNLVGSLLPADVYARYLRQRGEEVLYICGTDDHGAPAEIAAQEAGLPVAEYCAGMYQTQKDIYEQFNLSFDHFGRTSTTSNRELTQSIFKALDANGYIVEKTIQQYYSVADERFLADRHITGTCPKCNYALARGDQCDGCGALLDPTELINPRSSLNPKDKLELRETHHLFLDLPKLQGKVKQWTDSLDNPSKVVSGIIRKWLEEGLEQRCITRDLDWGIPVPKPGYEDKVFYVWFDAPNGYISITVDWAATTGDRNAWQQWWQHPENVQYTQFMAKDNVPFHAVMWPAILLGTGQNWKMVDYIKGFNWLTYAGGKFSTSQKRGVFTDTALELFPADYWRYYLMASVPESSDSDFSFADFAKVINHDLADSLGNFTARVLTLVEKYFSSAVPDHTDQSVDADLQQKTIALCAALDKAHNELKYRDVTANMRALWALGNEYITQQQPWTVAKQDMARTGYILSNCLHLLRTFAITSWAIMPGTAEKILALVSDERNPGAVPIAQAADFTCLPAGKSIAGKITLFSKIDEEKVAELERQFSGV
ncbi:MAG TPA: methionine--tRNA ligase [Gammaproteobacteria bacterium]|nr:methionine--tRNA ligase [Gammaproteobacteria bacterium]